MKVANDALPEDEEDQDKLHHEEGAARAVIENEDDVAHNTVVKRSSQSTGKTKASKPVKQSKAKVVKNEPRPLTEHNLRFVDKHYTRYDFDKPQPPSSVDGPFKKIEQFNAYHLYSRAKEDDVHDIPKHGVRLDDLAVCRVITQFTAKQLTRTWNAEFDEKGMIRATRTPLGRAAKIYVTSGDQDTNGDIVNPGEEGYYYKWWRGLHMLCGAEGREMYLIRPSHETFRCRGWTFKKGYKAVIQQSDDYDATGELVAGQGDDLELLDGNETQGNHSAPPS